MSGSCALLSVVGVDDVGAHQGFGLFQAGQRRVLVLLNPVVVLFCQDCSDQADDRVTVGEDAYDIGAPADFSVEAFSGAIRPDFLPVRFRRVAKLQQFI